MVRRGWWLTLLKNPTGSFGEKTRGVVLCRFNGISLVSQKMVDSQNRTHFPLSVSRKAREPAFGGRLSFLAS